MSRWCSNQLSYGRTMCKLLIHSYVDWSFKA